jgi:hypothetical protein
VGYGEVADQSPATAQSTDAYPIGKTFTVWESVMGDELEGYTHEEFCALLDLMQVRYVTRDPLARSPKDRMKIINYFRSQKRAERKVQEFLHEI